MSILSLAKSERSKNMQISNPCIFAKGNMWYIDYREVFDNGEYKKRQVSTKIKTSEKTHIYMVGKYLPAKWAQMQEGLLQKSVIQKTFGFFHDEFLNFKKNLISFDKTKARSRAALEYFGRERDIRTIKKFDVKKYVNQLEQTGIGGDTLASYYGMLSGILQLACEADLITTNPCRDLLPKFNKTPDEEATRPFEPEEVAVLLQNATGELLNYLGIAFNTGMSPEEILALMGKDIDFEARTIHICRVVTKGELRQIEDKQTLKTKKRHRIIPLFANALPYIQSQLEYAKSKKSLFLFCQANGQRYNDIQQIRGQKKNNTKWYGLLRACEIEYRDLKNARHTFAVEALKSGKLAPQEIADVLGHGSLRMLINHYAKWVKGNAVKVDPTIDIYSKAGDDKNDLSYSLSYSSKNRGF
jgi:integrase